MSHHEAAQPPRFPFACMHAFDSALLNAKSRSQDPVTRVELKDDTKAWIVIEQKDIYGALASEDLSADRRHPGCPEIHEGGHATKEARPTFINLDKPEHDQQQNMLQAAFEPGAVEKLRPMIQSVVDSNVEKLLSSGSKTLILKDVSQNRCNSLCD